MEQWTVFFEQRWFVIMIAIVLLWLVIKVIKTVFKWLIVLGIVVAIIVYGSTYINQLTDLYH